MPRSPDYVTLAEMGGRINTTFAKHLEEPYGTHTPYDWWKRTKSGDMSEPLPKPVYMIGRSPVFRWGDVVRWFVRYRGIGRK